MKPLAPNTLLQNRYLVVNLIGKGGMGEVYLAVDQRLGSAIALKRTFFSNDEMLRAAFEREARTLARLRHNVLPKVSDHFTEEETQYLIMEHISGDDLAKRLEITQKPFPVTWVLFWADQLLDALNYLHSHEPPIIHRDIKPQNLKLTDENSIVLLDFGLSKNSTGQTKLSTTGSVVGFTPYFAPMEQVRGTGTDARSDLYALSATFYQLLTNVIPPDALSRADAMLGGLPDPLIPINEINPEVTPLVSNILLKGMEVSQEKRFPTARSMQKALREAFAELQSIMSAKTVAIAPAEQLKVVEAPISQLKTELMEKPMTDHPTHSQLESDEKTEEFRYNPTDSSAESPKSQAPDFNATVVDNSPIEDFSPDQPDFNATIRDESFFENITPKQEDDLTKQSDVKTEVFLAGSTPEFSAVQEKDFSTADNFDSERNVQPADNFSKADEFTSEDDFKETNDKSKEENFSPFSTVPLFTTDNQENVVAPAYTPSDSMNFDSIPRAEEYSSEPPNYEKAEEHSSTNQINSLPPKPLPQKKSNRKALVIVGVLGAFFIFLLSAAGLGFYYYQNSGTTTENTTPIPTPEPTVEAPPTPEPTLETTANTDIKNDNSSIANTNNTDANTNDNKQPVTTPTVNTTQPPRTPKIPESVPQQTTPKPTPQQIRTPRSTPPPTPKPNPKPSILPRILP